MINVNSQKVKEIQRELHAALVKDSKGGKRVKEEIVMENRLFMVICRDITLAPPQIAVELNKKYGYQMQAEDALSILRGRRMAKPGDRKELLLWAQKVAEYFAAAVGGNRESFEKFEKLRKEPALKCGKKHDDQERMAAMMIYARYPELAMEGDVDMLQTFGKVLGKYFFYDMADAVAHVHGFPSFSDAKKKAQTVEEEKKMTYEEAIRRIGQLENSLDRTNIMLQDLQDEFEEQLAAAKVKELTDFFTLLNSEKYGYLLDELLIVRKGVDELRKKNYQLPIEINGLLIMVKKMIQFVRDSHIEPIMKPGTIRAVTAAEVEFCNYEGTPFETAEETKNVKVISPGWIYKEKEVQISRPKIREEG